MKTLLLTIFVFLFCASGYGQAVKPEQTATPDEILQFMDGKIAKWWLPNDVVFVDAIPHTATGKIQKTALRDQFKSYRFPNAAS